MVAPIPFGRYVLLDKLATGGMAELFLAKVRGEAGFEKTCVVKRLLPHLSVHEDFVAMFLDEARLAARLNHPGIVQVFDLGHAQDDYFLAMEYLAGEDLSAVLRRSGELGQPVPLDVAVRVIGRAAEALHFAHELKGAQGRSLELVHRDVSPSNLFITYQGAVKLLDFGIARAASQLRQTQAGQIKGKAPYMSPEQITGRGVDRRTDVWALGVCLHELLTGQRLFTGASSREVVSAVLEGAIPPVEALRPEVPPALSAVVTRALTRDRAERFQSAAELGAALEQPGLIGPGPRKPLGDYLTALFGGEQAEVRLRRASEWTASQPRPQTDGTEQLPNTDRTPLVTPAGESDVAGPGTSPTVSLRAGGSPSSESPGLGEALPRGPGTGLEGRVGRRLWPVATLAIAAAGGLSAWLLRSPDPTPSPDRPAVSSEAKLRAEPAEAVVKAPAPAPVSPEGVQAPPSPAQAVQAPTPAQEAPEALHAPAQTAPAETLPASAEATAPAPHRAAPRHRTSIARLSLDANLPAVAYLDGRRLGALPLSRLRVKAGTHRLRVRATGLGASRELRLSFEPGEALSRSIRFEKGKLNIDAEPWADVWVDGAKMGQTPLAGREVWEGRHSVRLAGPSGAKTLAVRVRPGETTVVNEKLSP